MERGVESHLTHSLQKSGDILTNCEKLAAASFHIDSVIQSSML